MRPNVTHLAHSSRGRQARSQQRRARGRACGLMGALGALALAVGACSDSGDALTNTFSRAVDATNTAETVSTRLTITFDDVEGVPPSGIVTDAVTTMDGGLGRGTISQFGEEIEFLVVDETYYYAFPGLPDGKKWARVTFDELESLSGLDVSGAAQQSPTESLERLQASGEVTEIGPDDVDGVATTQYRGRIEVARLADTGAMSDALIEQMRGLVGDAYDIDVWIDDADFVRKVQWQVDLAESPSPPAGVPDAGIINYEMTLYDFDQPLDVEAPPESEVASLTDPN